MMPCSPSSQKPICSLEAKPQMSMQNLVVNPAHLGVIVPSLSAGMPAQGSGGDVGGTAVGGTLVAGGFVGWTVAGTGVSVGGGGV